MIRYSRIQHAAHYAYGFVHPERGQGHDLEQWDAAEEDCQRGPRTGNPMRPEGVPVGAEYHSGYRDAEGKQRYLFVKPAPLTGTCPRCAPKTP